MPSKTYREILERYDRAKAFGEQRSLADYAKHLNDIYQTEDYTEGLRDGWWRRASTRIDQALEPTLGAVTEPIGEAVGSAFGYPEEGATVGRGLPRALIQSAPLYLLGPETGIPGTLAALGTTGAAFGAQTYADTGSPKAAAISGVTAGAMPLVGRFGGGIAGRLAGGERARLPGRLFSDVFGSEAAGNVGKVAGAQFAGSQAGMFGAQVASTVAQRRALGEEVGLSEVLSDPHLWLGQIPFTVYDTVRAVRTKPTSIEKVRPFLDKPLEKQIVPPKPGVGSDEARAQAEAMIQQFELIIKDEKSSPEQKAAATQNVIKGVLTPEKLAEKKAVQKVTTPEPNVVLSGKTVKEGPPGHWRISVDEVMKEDGTSIQPPEHKTVRVISDVPPRFNEQLGVWTWSGPQSALRLNAEWPLSAEPDLPLPGAELPVRPPGVEPTSAKGVHVPGTGGGELFNLEGAPDLQGQPIELDEVQTLVQMGADPQAVQDRFVRSKRQKAALFLGEALTKSKNAVLNLFQGKVLRDPQGTVRVLGGRDIPGTPMPEREFVSRSGISPTLVPLFRQHYPEAFDAEGRVDPTKLVKGLEERPLVEVQKAGQTEAGRATGERSRQDIQHDVENLGFAVEEPNEGTGVPWGITQHRGNRFFQEGTPEFEANVPENVKRLFAAYKAARDVTNLTYSPHYSISSNPKGGTEIAVVAKGTPSLSEAERNELYDIQERKRYGTISDKEAKRLQELNAKTTPLPSDVHHDVPGLLGTATVEEKTLGELRAIMGPDHPKLQRFAGKPDDAVVGVVTEAQSDWGSERFALDRWEVNQAPSNKLWYVGDPKGVNGGNDLGKAFDTREEAELQLKAAKEGVQIPGAGIHRFTPTHPLLPYWERLVADAVIQHGLERKWEGVVVTDAKTAAMTEGHDVGTPMMVRGEHTLEKLKGHVVYGYSGDEYVLNGKIDVRDTGPWFGTDKGYIQNSSIKSQKANSGFGIDEAIRAVPTETPIEEFPGHAQHYGDPDFRIGPEVMPGSLQQEFAKATGERNTVVGGGENVLAVGVHKGAIGDNTESVQTVSAEGLKFDEANRIKQELRVSDPTAKYVTNETDSGWQVLKVEPKLVGSLSLTEPHPVTGVVGPKVYATGNYYSLDNIRGGLEIDTNLAIKEAVMRFQQAQQRIADAKAKQVVVPTKAEEWAGLVGFHWSPVTDITKFKARDYVGQHPTGPVEPTGFIHFGTSPGVLSRLWLVDKDGNFYEGGGREYKVRLNVKNLFDATNFEDLDKLSMKLYGVKHARLEGGQWGEGAVINKETLELVEPEVWQKAGLGKNAAEGLAKLGYDGAKLGEDNIVVFDPDKIEIIDSPEHRIKSALSSGATPTQAAETARLVSTTSEIAAATHEADVAALEARMLSQAPQGEGDLIKDYGIFVKHKTSKTEKHGPSLKDENGKRMMFPTKAEAEAYRLTKLENPEKYATFNAGRRKQTTATPEREVTERGFYLAEPEVVQSRQANLLSLDKPTDEGTTLHSAIGEATPQMEHETSPELLGEVSDTFNEVAENLGVTEVQRNLELAANAPRVFANATGLDVPAAIQLIKRARVALATGSDKLGDMNHALEQAGLPKFESEKDKQKTLALAREGAREFAGLKSPALSSNIPHNEELVNAIGIRESLTKALTWIGEQWMKSTDVYVQAQGRLIRELLKAFPNADGDVDVLLPGTTGWHPRRGWLFWKEAGVRSKINMEHLPYDHAEAVDTWGQNLVHEFTHHATRELAFRDDPAAMEFRKVLKEAREAISNSKALPKGVREAIRVSVAEDHVGKFARGELTLEQLYDKWRAFAKDDTQDFFQIIYGASNDHEFMAQTFGDPEMLALVRNTKMPKTPLKTVLDFFVEGWNKLFGRQNVQDNVLAQVLSKFDSYLVPQRFADGYSGRDYIRDILVDTFGTRDVALASRIQTVERVFNTGHLGHSILGFQREDANGMLPVTSRGGELNQSLRTSLMVGLHHDVYHATLDLLPEEVPVAQELWWRMNQDVQMAKQTIAEVERGAVPGKVSKDAKQTLRVSEQKVQRMKEALDKQALDIQRLKNLNQLTIEGWEQALYDQVTAEAPLSAPPDPVPNAAELRKQVALEGLAGRSTTSWFARNFALTQFFKEMYPSVKQAVGNVFAQQGAAVDRAKKLMLGFYWNPNLPDGKGRNGSIDPKIITQVKRVRKSPAMTQTTSDLFRYQNKELKGQTLDLSDPYVRQELSTYRPEDRDAIVQVLNSQAFRHKTAVEHVYTPFFAELNREYTAHLIGSREVGMQPEVARDFANKLHEAIGKTAIPELAAVGAAELQALAGQMTPDTYIRAIQHVTELSQKTTKWLGAIRDKPGYTPEQRYGKHQLWMLNPKTNKRSHDSSDDLQELVAIQQRKAAQGYETLDLIHAEDTLSPRMGMREEFLKSLEDLDAFNESLVNSLTADLSPELRSALKPAISRAGDVRAQIESASPLPKVARRFAEGRESINMLDNADQFYSRMNNWMKNKMVKAKSNVDLLSPELQGNRELRRFVQQHVDNFTTPDNPLARKFTEATYFYKLAFDFGNALLESTQFLTTGMSSLVGETGSVGQAFDLVRSALAKEAKHAVKKTYGSKELDDFMEWADRNGHGGHAAWNDMSDIDQHNYYAASGAESPVGVLQNKARNFSLFFSKRNARIGLLAAYELARSRGMSVEESRAFAVDVKARGAFDEGKAQRAVGLFGIKSRPVPQLMAALQNYTLGWFSQMALNWKRGFSGKPPAGLTETQRLGAKKAFFYSLAAQAALAGALGLPGVGQGLALLNQATGIDLKGKTLQTLAEMFDEDTQLGGTLTGLAMRGIGAYGLPFDPSNRASISVPFLGVDAYKGFNVANLGGAATATVGDFVEGLMGLARGDTQATSKLLPNVAKRPFQLATGEGDIRDERKTLLYQLSPAERWLQALGLSPARVQSARDTAEAVKKLNVAAQRQRDSFVDSVASTIRKGDIPTAQLLLQEYLAEHPEVDAQSLARSVAGRVEAQSVPYDWRRDVNPGVELAGLSSRMPSSEVLRRNVRGEVMSQLGLPEVGNLQGDYRAMLLDEMLNSDPRLSRSAAVRQLSSSRKRPALGRNIWQEQ